MSAALFMVLLALLPIGMLFTGSAALVLKRRTVSSLLQLPGTGFLAVAVLTHLFEALRLFPWMHWGLDNSPGHDLDLSSALLGLTLFPRGYLLHALATR